jgi:hypothetical protein
MLQLDKSIICRDIALLRQQAKEQRREKMQALSLAKECYSMKIDLLTIATVVDDAIRFVSEKSKDKDKEDQVKSSTSKNLMSLIIMKTKSLIKKEKKTKNRKLGN